MKSEIAFCQIVVKDPTVNIHQSPFSAEFSTCTGRHSLNFNPLAH